MQIYLEHNNMFVDVAHIIEVDQKELKSQNPANQLSEESLLDQLSETNRLRKKFPQIDRRILQRILTKWLQRQNFLTLRKTQKRQVLRKEKDSKQGESIGSIEEDVIQDKIYVNGIELSQDYSYLIVNVHVVEYLNFKAKRAHVNKDILISLIDLRSPVEN